MSTANACGTHNVQNRYGTGGVDFGKKFISEIMDASQKDEKWATNIMEADRQQVTVGYLNPRGRTNNNLYGALLTPVEIQVPQASKDPTVKEMFQKWGANLKEDFPRMSGYSPQTLGERAANLIATAGTLRKSLEKLCANGEVAKSDATQWSRIIDTLEAYGEAAKKLHAAVCAGPGIEHVTLDIPARSH